MKRATLWLAVLGMALGGALHAQEDDDAGRGVARISLIGGDVSVRRGDSGEWVAAALNAPVVADDTLSTGAGARAEVQFDNANMIRVAGDSEVRLAQLEDDRYVVQIARGTVTFRVLRDTRADVELDTPSVSVRPSGRGAYRITVREDGESEITVRSGEAEIFTPGGAERLRPGSTMEVRGSASDPQFRLLAEIRRDSWDEWNVSRDRRLEASRSYRYADRTIYGVEDLDDYGVWVTVSSYGYVWRPRVAVGWSPYYYGRWVWVDYYGWTWLSYDPWGWAPYHYGRWFWDTGYGWCWWPGGYGIRHRWSPALVAFFGYGYGGVGAGFGFHRVGWVPLGPHEPYHRWYGRGFYRGFREGFPGDHIRVERDFDLRRSYRNAGAPNGIVGMDAGAFGRGGRAERPQPGEVTRAGLVRGMLPLAPGRESLRLSDREASRATIRPAVTDRAFAARTQIRREDRVSFEEQRRAMERGIQSAAAGRGAAGNAGFPGRAAAGGAAPGRSEAVAPAPNRTGDMAMRPDQAGWRRLGGGAANPGGETRATARPGADPRPAEQAAPGGWRTLPEAAGGANSRSNQGNGAAERNAGRFGTIAPPRERETAPGGSDASQGWRGFENRTGALPRTQDLRTTAPRGEARGAAPGGPGASPQPRASGAERELRINPPLVRERPGGSGMNRETRPPAAATQPRPGGGYGGDYAAPRPSEPAFSAPGGAPRRDYGSMRDSRPIPAAPRAAGGGYGSMRSPAPSYSGGGPARNSGPAFSGGGRPSGGGMAPGGGGGARPSGGGGRPAAGGGRTR